MSTFLLNREKLNKILKTFQTGVFLPNSERGGNVEQTWIHDTVRFTNLQVLVPKCVNIIIWVFLLHKQATSSTIVGCITIIACVTASGISKEKALPFGSLLIARYCSYELVLVFQTVVSEMAMLQFMMVDVLYASILAHLCLQCKLLQNTIKRMIINSIKAVQKVRWKDFSNVRWYKFSSFKEQQNTDVVITTSDIPWEYLEKAIKDVVVYHMSIVKLSDEVEEVFNIPTLTVFTSMSLCICFILYQGSIVRLVDQLVVNTQVLKLNLSSILY